MRRIFGIAAFAGVAAFAALAQESGNIFVQKLNVESGVMGQPVLGAPYSATEINETTQTLADGTKIHNENQIVVYRDGAGRSRRDNANNIVIMDPVAKVRYILNVERKTAIAVPLGFVKKGVVGAAGQYTFVTSDRMTSVASTANSAEVEAKLKAELEQQLALQAAQGEPRAAVEKKVIAKANRRANTKTEDIGPQTMEGVVAQGTRTTRIIETGAVGNDRPITIVSERWFSPQLQTVMMTKQNDPRSGENVFRLSNVKLGEPDASLFQVPAGYQVIEGK